MSLSFDAIFENGVLRPLVPVEIPDHSRVHVSVDVASALTPGRSSCAGLLSAEAAAEMRQIVRDEFEQVDERDW